MDPRIINATLEIADKFRVPPHHALAFVEVESNGDAFDPVAGQNKALIRWEGHYFWRRLKNHIEARQAARDRGLAHPSAGGIKNTRSQEGRYDILNRAENLCHEYGVDPDLAYECISIGLGQVMGSHWEDLGYDSARSMLEEAHNETFDIDVQDQIEMIFKYLERNHLLDEVVRGDWVAAAHGYNGPAYAKNRYDTKLAAAARKWKKRLNVGAQDATEYPTLRIGSRRDWAVQHLQSSLKNLGYNIGAVDGSFGRLTRDAVLAFQADNNLVTDGVVGNNTWSTLETAPAKRPVSNIRSTATVQDLRDSGSKTVALGDGVRATGIALSGASAVSLGVGEAQEGVETASRWVQVLQDGRQLVGDNWEIVLLGAAMVILFLGWQVVQNRLEDHRSGKHIGRG